MNAEKAQVDDHL